MVKSGEVFCTLSKGNHGVSRRGRSLDKAPNSFASVHIKGTGKHCFKRMNHRTDMALDISIMKNIPGKSRMGPQTGTYDVGLTANVKSKTDKLQVATFV